MNRLKELRINKSLTLKQLSSELNKKYDMVVSDGQLSNYENGKRQPRNSKFWEKLADYFGVSVAYIMGVSDDPEVKEEIAKEKVSDKVLTVAAHIDDDVNEDEMKEILSFIDYIKNRDHKK